MKVTNKPYFDDDFDFHENTQMFNEIDNIFKYSDSSRYSNIHSISPDELNDEDIAYNVSLDYDKESRVSIDIMKDGTIEIEAPAVCYDDIVSDITDIYPEFARLIKDRE